jgi:hypothetical protein
VMFQVPINSMQFEVDGQRKVTNLHLFLRTEVSLPVGYLLLTKHKFVRLLFQIVRYTVSAFSKIYNRVS